MNRTNELYFGSLRVISVALVRSNSVREIDAARVSRARICSFGVTQSSHGSLCRAA